MDNSDNTQALIENARLGKREAFDEIVKRYTNSIAFLIQLEIGVKLKQKVEVDDLVQETFARAFQAIQQFRGQDQVTFGRWLATIALHVVQDQARLLRGAGDAHFPEISLDKQFGSSTGAPGLAAGVEATGATPSEHMRQMERFERLRHALARLSPSYRKVIILARIRNLPMKEVAQQMGRSADATSMLLLRALLKLKAAFGTTERLELPDNLSLDDEELLSSP